MSRIDSGRATGHSDDDERVTAERVARNEAIFRAANDHLKEAAAEHGLARGELGPFICECADPGCTDVLLLDGNAYERVRSNPRWFLNAPGHQAASQGTAKVVERHDAFLIVEKEGLAGEIAEELEGSASPETAPHGEGGRG